MNTEKIMNSMTPKQQAENREKRRSILEEIMTSKGHSPKSAYKPLIKDLPDYDYYMSKGSAKVKMPSNGNSNLHYQDEITIDPNGVMACNIFIKTDRPIVEGKSRKKVAIGLEDLLSRRRCHSIQTLTIVNSLSKHGSIYNTNVQHYERLKRLPTREELQSILPTIKQNLAFVDQSEL